MPGTAVTTDSTVSMPSPASRVAPEVVPPKRTARPLEVGFLVSLGVKPGALYPLDGAVIAGNGGDQCRHAVDAVICTMDEIGMKPQGREAAVADGAGVQIGFRMGAIDGPATPPEAARRFFTVIAADLIAAIGGGERRLGEEGAGLLHGVPKRCSAGVQTDEIEQIAMLVGRAVGPFTGYAWRRQAHEERAPLGAACVADGPVSALLASAGKVATADVFGPCA